MSDDLAVLNQKVDDMGADISGINKELKQVNESLKHLIRIDGDIKRIEEKIDRIGVQADDHENRLRTLERKSGALFERVAGHVLSSSIGGVVVFFILKGIG